MSARASSRRVSASGCSAVGGVRLELEGGEAGGAADDLADLVGRGREEVEAGSAAGDIAGAADEEAEGFHVTGHGRRMAKVWGSRKRRFKWQNPGFLPAIGGCWRREPLRGLQWLAAEAGKLCGRLQSRAAGAEMRCGGLQGGAAGAGGL